MKGSFFLLLCSVGFKLFSQTPGSLDTSFNPGTSTIAGYYKEINDAVLLPDGKILIGGAFTSYNGNPANKIARINPDGSFDSSFTIGTGFGDQPGSQFNSVIYDLEVQADGKILASGRFSNYNNVARTGVVRLNADGSLDNSFAFPISIEISHVLSQTDGKVIIGGGFSYYYAGGPGSMTPLGRILRLNTDGSVDNSYNIGTGFDNYVSQLIPLPNGKIIVAGGFNNYNNAYHRGMVRLNTDGTADNTFQQYNGFNGSISDIALTPDGGFFVSGFFSSFDGIPCKRVVKLLPNGYLDFSFAIHSSINLNLEDPAMIVAQQNGKLVICSAGTYNGQFNYIWHILRVNTDGTYDSSFAIAPGFSDYADGILIQPDGKLIAYGPFLNYNNTPINHIARINGDDVLSTPEFDNIKVKIYPNPSASNIHITGFGNEEIIQAISITDMSGKEVITMKNTKNDINIQNLQRGVYCIRILKDNKNYVSKFVKL